jgi:hypothetical protein
MRFWKWLGKNCLNISRIIYEYFYRRINNEKQIKKGVEMLCSICNRPELGIRSDGVKYDPAETSGKKGANQIVCSRCTNILSQCKTKIDWDMNIQGMKSAFTDRAVMRRTR